MPEKAKEAHASPKVPISSLNTLDAFKYEGQVYTKRKAGPSGIKALSKKGTEVVTLPPDTLVSKI